jgi:hypothetical protein
MEEFMRNDSWSRTDQSIIMIPLFLAIVISIALVGRILSDSYEESLLSIIFYIFVMALFWILFIRTRNRLHKIKNWEVRKFSIGDQEMIYILESILKENHTQYDLKNKKGLFSSITYNYILFESNIQIELVGSDYHTVLSMGPLREDNFDLIRKIQNEIDYYISSQHRFH